MKKNIVDITFISLFCALLTGLGIAILLLPKQEVSEVENRPLANVIAPTPQGIADGSFFASISDFYSDRFPLRTKMTAAKALCELCLGKGENNDIIFGRDGYLIPKGEYQSFKLAERNTAFLSELANLASERSVPVYYALAPRSIDVMQSALPVGYCGNYEAIWGEVSIGSAEEIDLLTPIKESADNGEYVWYKTDHHWTTRGAYLAYCALGKSLGYTPYPEEFFSVESVSDDFVGTSHSTAGGICLCPDTIELYRYEGDGDVTVTLSDGDIRSGIYSMEGLNSKDKYAIFLGGNHSLLTVSHEKSTRRLIIIKDSYANSLIPFLALHFDLTVIDPRYFNGSYSEIITNEADAFLILQGIDTVATTPLF